MSCRRPRWCRFQEVLNKGKAAYSVDRSAADLLFFYRILLQRAETYYRNNPQVTRPVSWAGK
jgi:hypothetical protein